MTNAADVDGLDEIDRKDRERLQREAKDLKLILESREGRRFVWKWLGKCGVFKSSMTGNSHTFFNEGMRNIGLMLLHEVTETMPEAYSLMAEEAKADSF